MNNSVTIDTSQVERLFAGLRGKDQRKAMIDTLRSSGKILQKATEIEFKSKINISGLRINYVKNGKAKRKWLRVATLKIDTKEPSAKVHIMADFRAKFFEMGTKKRRTKGNKITGSYWQGKRKYLKRTGQGGNRGSITAGHYFAKAQRNTEREIFGNMANEMTRAIIKIAKKYNGAA